MNVIQAEFNPFLIFVLVAALMLVFGIFALMQAAKRREAWRQLAQRLGCRYSSSDPFDIEVSCPHSLFDNGHSRRAYNVLHGIIDKHELKCFDYVYKTTSGTGKNRSEQSHYHTCLLIDAPIPFQNLWIRPESFLDRIGEFVGLDDIDFESDEFSRKFFIKCNDKRFAYDIIHARVMELLLECGKVHLEAQGRQLLFYYTGSLHVPEKIQPLIQNAVKFVELTPNYMIEQARSTH